MKNLYEITIVAERDLRIVSRVEAPSKDAAEQLTWKKLKQVGVEYRFGGWLPRVRMLKSGVTRRYQVEQTFQDFEAGTPPQVKRFPKIYKSRRAAEEKARNFCWSTQPHGVDHPLSRSIAKVVEISE